MTTNPRTTDHHQEDPVPDTTTAPRYAADLTPADVNALVKFVNRQLSTAEASFSSPEGKAVSATRTAVNALAGRLDGAMAQLDSLDSETGTATGTTYDVQAWWGILVSVAHPWAETPGYDTVRWRHIPHASPRDEKLSAEISARLDAETEAAR